jgi:PPOX class probable F420-dependent enzyme
MPLARQEIIEYLRTRRYCVQASIAEDGAPQAAVVGFAVSDDLELVFDTLGSTRKAANLRRDPRIALVVGAGEDERTAQITGVADEPRGEELARLKAVYFAAFPDGPEREGWPEITYFRVRPTELRYSDFAHPGGPLVEQHRF